MYSNPLTILTAAIFISFRLATETYLAHSGLETFVLKLRALIFSLRWGRRYFKGKAVVFHQLQ